MSSSVTQLRAKSGLRDEDRISRMSHDVMSRDRSKLRASGELQHSDRYIDLVRSHGRSRAMYAAVLLKAS